MYQSTIRLELSDNCDLSITAIMVDNRDDSMQSYNDIDLSKT